MSTKNINIIITQYNDLHQSDITGTDLDRDYAQRCGYVSSNTEADEDGTNDEDGLRAQISEENKTNAVIANRDLRSIANRMFFLFPSQRRNFRPLCLCSFVRSKDSNLTDEKSQIKNSEIHVVEQPAEPASVQPRWKEFGSGHLRAGVMAGRKRRGRAYP